jgi:hypothetical protein
MATQATTWNHLLAAIPDEAMSSLFPTASNDGNNYCRDEDKPHSSSSALVAAVTTSHQEAKEEHAEQEPTDMASRSSLKAKNRKTKRSGKWTVRIVFRKCFLDVLLTSHQRLLRDPLLLKLIWSGLLRTTPDDDTAMYYYYYYYHITNRTKKNDTPGV